MPLIEDIYDKLEGSKFYCVLDLKNAYNHIKIEPNSRKYTGFLTHNNQDVFNYMPFGLTNAPAVFQKYIQIIFKQLLNDNTVIIYWTIL